MEGAPHNFQLLEPPSPEALVPDSRLEAWMVVVVVAGLLVLALVAFFILSRKNHTPVNPAIARNAARAEAAAALEAVSTAASARDAAVQCSWIIRKYLSIAAGDPALFETHEEYLSRHEALRNFTPEARSAAEKGFSRLVRLKYASSRPDVETAAVVSESRSLLETLHQGLVA